MRSLAKSGVVYFLSVLLSACALATGDAILSESRFENCKSVGLSRKECVLVEAEIDRLRAAGDFAALKSAYRELIERSVITDEEEIPSVSPHEVIRCNPRIIISDDRMSSCGTSVLGEEAYRNTL